jgi:cytochrome c oxidase assembly factor CtaG
MPALVASLHPAGLVPPLAASLHPVEMGVPLAVATLYLVLYGRRAAALARERRPVPSWRIASFVGGVALMTIVQLGPLDDLADSVLAAHMVQHLVIGDFASLFIVLGLTGPVLQPLLHMRPTRPLRVLASPIVALVLWTLNLYMWHLPFFYQAAIEHDLVHALEHACMLWFGVLLWLALIGPLPKPAWFSGWGALGYVIAVRFAGALLANVLIWSQTVFYPVYRATDAARGLSPLSDQNLAGAVMMIEESILTLVLLGWLFFRFAMQDEQRQSLVDLAAERGIELSDERAARAARAGRADALRERLLAGAPVDSAGVPVESADRLDEREHDHEGWIDDGEH